MDVAALRGLAEDAQTALVRVDFTDDAAWHRLMTLTLNTSFDEGDDPYLPNIVVLDDPSYDGVTPQAIADAVDRATDDLGYLLLADSTSMTEVEQGTLATLVYANFTIPFGEDEEEEWGRSFRCVIAEVASIEANLSISNMDFWDFADYADERGGVFRGFEPGD